MTCGLGLTILLLALAAQPTLTLTAGNFDPDDKSFHASAQFGTPKEILEHLAAGADVNARNDRGWTPLHVAAGRDAYVHQILVDRGANVNARTQDSDDNTVLVLVSQFSANTPGAADKVEALVEHGAQVNSQNAHGDTATERLKSASRRNSIASLSASSHLSLKAFFSSSS